MARDRSKAAPPAVAPGASSDRRKVQVLIVDDHPIFREGLRQVINAEADLVVQGEASGAAQALEAATAQPPDIAIVDLTLEQSNG